VIRCRFILTKERLLAVCWLLLLVLWVSPAFATPSEWKPNGGVTNPTDYVDYGSAIVGNTYQTDIEQATRLGLVVGHDDRSFRPNDNITVGQFANIIARNYWQRGASDEANLAYLRSLGVSVTDPNTELTVGQLRTIADAVGTMAGVAELAILNQVKDGSLVPTGSNGGITRGQAVDLVNRSAGSSGSGGTPTGGSPVRPADPPSSPDDERPQRQPRTIVDAPTLSATVSPNPAKRQQLITIIATVHNITGATAQLPWQEVSLSGSGSQRSSTARVPADLTDGTYQVIVRGIGSNGTVLTCSLELVIRGDILDDINFVITD